MIYETPYGHLQVDTFDHIRVVRDDLYAGGTKARILPSILEEINAPETLTYASPVYGYAQIALAYAAKQTGRHAVIFVAKRKVMHPRTLEAYDAGATIIEVPYGYLSNTTSKAAACAEREQGLHIPFGVDLPAMRSGLRTLASCLPEPFEVWTVAGSGTFTRSLQEAWQKADFYAVRVGSEPQAGRASVYVAPEPFEKDAKINPPFPSCSNYDAKAWRFIIRSATPGALFWNVAS